MSSSAKLETFWHATRTIACIGRNYVAHAAEMKSDAPTTPFFFLKPASSLLVVSGKQQQQRAARIELPRFVGSVHHEVELAVVIGERARHVAADDAMRCVAGYALAIDVTARDLQAAAKSAGLPWTRAKGYDTFCPIGGFIPAASVANPHALRLSLAVNGVTRQDGRTSDMIFRISELIAHISSIMTLSPCDVILTGTPSGVGPLVHGDKVLAQLFDGATNDELQTLCLDVVDEPNGPQPK